MKNKLINLSVISMLICIVFISCEKESLQTETSKELKKNEDLSKSSNSEILALFRQHEEDAQTSNGGGGSNHGDGWSCGGEQYYGYGNGVTHSNITGRTYMVDNTTVTEITEAQGLTWCQRNASWADPNYPNDEFPIPTGGSGGDNNDVLQSTGNN